MSELGPDSIALLEAARSVGAATPADREYVRARVLAHLAAAAAVSTTTSAAGATHASMLARASTGSVVAKVALVVTVVAGTGIGGVFAAHHWGREPLSAAPSVPAAEPSASVPVEAAPFVVSSPPPADPAPAASLRAVPLRALAPAAPDASNTLEEETRLLRAAGVALGRGEAEQAIALLDEHAGRYPNGLLSEERAATRVFALCALGRTSQAQRDATTFLRTRPHSPLAARVRASCGVKSAP
jgi:hypothetical protein